MTFKKVCSFSSECCGVTTGCVIDDVVKTCPCGETPDCPKAISQTICPDCQPKVVPLAIADQIVKRGATHIRSAALKAAA